MLISDLEGTQRREKNEDSMWNQSECGQREPYSRQRHKSCNLKRVGALFSVIASWGYLKETVERTLILTFSLIKTFKMWSKEINHTLLVEMEDGTATLEKNVAVSYKTKHATPIWPSHCTLGHVSQSNKNLCLHKNLYTHVHRSFICDDHKLGTTQKFFSM